MSPYFSEWISGLTGHDNRISSKHGCFIYLVFSTVHFIIDVTQLTVWPQLNAIRQLLVDLFSP